MGNKNIQTLPTVISKNWEKIQNESYIYRNKLTSECVRQFTVKINQQNEIQQLKTRIKQSNPYICRVFYYCHLSQNLYNVYTDETRNSIQIKNTQQWRTQKQNIIDTFVYLSKRYMPTRVCRQMIRTDAKGHIKVWINPNPVINEVWSPCRTQSEMIADILGICRQIGQQCCLIKRNIFIPDKNRFQIQDKQRNQGHRQHQPNKPNRFFNIKQSQKQYYHNNLHLNQKNGLNTSRNNINRIFSPRSSKQVMGNQIKQTNTDFKFKNSQRVKTLTFHRNSSEVFFPNICHDKNLRNKKKLLWQRTRTQSFNKIFLSRQNHFKNANIQQSSEIGNQIYSRSCSNKNKILKKQKSFVYRLNRQHNQIRKNGFQKKRVSKDRSLSVQKSYQKKAFKVEISTKSSFQQTGQSLTSSNFNNQQSRISPVKKLDSKLTDVARIPVRQQRESELTYTDLKMDRSVHKNNKKSMNVSQQILLLLNDSMDQSEQNIIRESVMIRLQDQLDGLFS